MAIGGAFLISLVHSVGIWRKLFSHVLADQIKIKTEFGFPSVPTRENIE